MIPFRLYLIGSLIFILLACSNEDKKNNPEKTAVETIVDNSIISNFNYDTLQQSYQGNFGDSFIYLVLNYVSETRAVGFSLFKGIQRNISGEVTWKEGKIQLSLKEPGDLPSDGTFTLLVNPENLAIHGDWIPMNDRVSARSFDVTPRKKTPNEEKMKSAEFPIVNEFNFTNIFYHASSDEADIYFYEEGFCLAEIKNHDDEGAQKQVTEVYGNWRFTGSQKMEIHWMKNDYLRPNKMAFQIQMDEYDYPSLVGDLTLYPYMY